MSETLKQRMRERGSRMKETMNQTTDFDGPSPRKDDTWAAAMDTTAETPITEIPTILDEDEEDEEKQSEELLSTLATRRKRAKKEITQKLEDRQEDEKKKAGLRERMRQQMKERLASTSIDQEQPPSPDKDVISPLPLRSDTPESGEMSPTRLSSRRDTLGLPVEGTDRPLSARSPRRPSTLSMKQKLADKLRAAKEKAREEVQDETVRGGRKLAGIRGLPRTTRFDDPSMMSAEDFKVEEELDRVLTARSRRENIKTPAKGPVLPTPDDQYDFFTRIWEPEPDRAVETAQEGMPSTSGEMPPAGEESAEGVEEAKEAENEDGEAGTSKKKKKKPDVPEDEEPLLDVVTADDWKFYSIGRAEYKPFREKQEDEENTLFVPPIIPAPVEEKIFEQEVPRYLEEEGLYVGRKPSVPRRHLNRMENRLLKNKEANKGWFGEDGRLIALPDPLKEVPSRPPIPEDDENPLLQTDFHKAIVTKFDSRFIDGSLDSYGRYQLDVDINTVTFTHHHLFSREHVLAYRLSQLCQQHAFRSRRRAAHFMSEKLKAAKAAVLHVQETINRLKEDNPEATGRWADQQHRLYEYKNEIIETRQQRDLELRADRTLMRNIIHTWKQLKDLRQYQKFTNTTVKLQIRRENTNKAADERELEQELEDELQEMRQQYEDDYIQKLNQYKQKIERWKQQKIEKKEARLRQKEKKKKMKKKAKRRTTDEENESHEEIDDTHNDTENEQEERDKEILEMDKLEKPEKPIPFDEAAVRQRILERFDEIRRKPGEPILHPELSNGAAVTQTHLCPRGEQTRRNELNKYKCFVKVLFNNKEVSRTQSKPIGQEFIVRFAEIFNVQIVQWPENIKLQIFETTGFTNTLLSELYVSIPDSQVTADTLELDTLQFSCELTISHSHEGVGSGMPFSFEADKSNMIICNTTGSLVAGVAWGLDDHGNVLVPTMSRQTGHQLGAMKGLDAVAAIGASGVSDPQQLLKWISKSRLDPNDPANADLMTLLRPAAGEAGDMGNLQMKEHFRLEQLQQEFDFVTDDVIENSRRFRILQFREEEVPEFRNFKMVPPHDKEIPDEVFDEYEKKKRDEDKVRHMDEMESHRVAVAKFMQRVREEVMMRFRIAQHQKTLSDVVFEDALPNISTIVPNLMKLVEPRHPLRPQRKQRKKMTAGNLQQIDVKLLVNIVRAFDIPVRAEALQPANAQGTEATATAGGMEGTFGGTMGDTMGGTLGGTRGSMRDTFAARSSMRGSIRNRGQGGGNVKNIAGEVLVRPFVEVMFQRNTIATSVADGPNPSWNEELKVPFRAPNNDYSSVNLQTVKDVIYINLFDEYVIDMVQDDRERGTSVHRRIEKRWLGSIKLPFSTVYFNSRIDGTFRINKPPVLLGYTHDPSSSRDGELGIGAGDADSTYITMFVTIEPPLQPAEPAKEKFESSEDEKLLAICETWQTDLHNRFPSREYKTTVVDINGKSVFMTRYFKPLKPPEEIINNQESATSVQDLVARFVSLIPFVSDSVVFPGLCDIWSTCDQFLQMLQGDEEEHAVLLVNYFLHLGKKAWLVLGSAVPEGPTAYVLTVEDGGRRAEYKIWNASTGESYSYRDNYCPLQSIGCVANADNIWANIQPVDQPSRVSFDFNNTSKWKPFFHKGFPHPGLSSVQPENLIYYETDSSFVLDLQDKIERQLKDRMMEWRPRHITRWNRHCMQSFRTLLRKLEYQRGRGVQQEHANELQNVLGSYKMSGFPINMPYTEMAPLVEAVYATGVHNNETNDVEFAVAVHIHPYPNSILSVWIYVASLVRKR